METECLPALESEEPEELEEMMTTVQDSETCMKSTAASTEVVREAQATAPAKDT